MQRLITLFYAGAPFVALAASLNSFSGAVVFVAECVSWVTGAALIGAAVLGVCTDIADLISR